jgi:hypothetical protein
MRFLKNLEARREVARAEKTKRRVEEVSRSITVSLFDKVSEDEVGPYSFEVGKKPKHLSGEEYLDRINERVAKNLGGLSLKAEVIYDKEESRERNLEYADLSGPQGQNWQQRVKDEMVIVYHPAPDRTLVNSGVLVE